MRQAIATATTAATPGAPTLRQIRGLFQYQDHPPRRFDGVRRAVALTSQSHAFRPRSRVPYIRGVGRRGAIDSRLDLVRNISVAYAETVFTGRATGIASELLRVAVVSERVSGGKERSSAVWRDVLVISSTRHC